MMPNNLLEESQKLINKGVFSNFSELIRQGVREELMKYKEEISDDEKKLLRLLKKADEQGQLLDEKEMAKHGLKI